jgi:hypothetical protein
LLSRHRSLLVVCCQINLQFLFNWLWSLTIPSRMLQASHRVKGTIFTIISSFHNHMRDYQFSWNINTISKDCIWTRNAMNSRCGILFYWMIHWKISRVLIKLSGEIYTKSCVSCGYITKLCTCHEHEMSRDITFSENNHKDFLKTVYVLCLYFQMTWASICPFRIVNICQIAPMQRFSYSPLSQIFMLWFTLLWLQIAIEIVCSVITHFQTMKTSWRHRICWRIHWYRYSSCFQWCNCLGGYENDVLSNLTRFIEGLWWFCWK